MATDRCFDAARAMLRGPDLFRRFRISDDGTPAAGTGLSPSTELLTFAVGRARFALLTREMAYHHLAQGAVNGVPFMVSFCGVCNSGVGMTPLVDGAVHHFSAGGLYNGVVLLIDDETQSYWDHITGRALHGPLAGRSLETWGIEQTTVGALGAEAAGVRVFRSRSLPLRGRFMRRIQHLMFRFNWLPPFFNKTMAPIDSRLPKLSMGLGVIDGGEARFYPLDAVRRGVADDWSGRTLRATVGANGIPVAAWEDGGKPMQLFSRWYGFVLTFPDCAVYGNKATEEQRTTE